jgi:hypothetical protein
VPLEVALPGRPLRQHAVNAKAGKTSAWRFSRSSKLTPHFITAFTISSSRSTSLWSKRFALAQLMWRYVSERVVENPTFYRRARQNRAAHKPRTFLISGDNWKNLPLVSRQGLYRISALVDLVGQAIGPLQRGRRTRSGQECRAIASIAHKSDASLSESFCRDQDNPVREYLVHRF